MNIVLTGSISNVGKPLTVALIKKGHSVTVISSHPERRAAIEALGAKAAIGKMQDAVFLTKTFTGADIVYLMETLDAAGDFFDKDVDFLGVIDQIGQKITVIRRRHPALVDPQSCFEVLTDPIHRRLGA